MLPVLCGRNLEGKEPDCESGMRSSNLHAHPVLARWCSWLNTPDSHSGDREFDPRSGYQDWRRDAERLGA